MLELNLPKKSINHSTLLYIHRYLAREKPGHPPILEASWQPNGGCLLTEQNNPWKLSIVESHIWYWLWSMTVKLAHDFTSVVKCTLVSSWLKVGPQTTHYGYFYLRPSRLILNSTLLIENSLKIPPYLVTQHCLFQTNATVLYIRVGWFLKYHERSNWFL